MTGRTLDGEWIGWGLRAGLLVAALLLLALLLAPPVAKGAYCENGLREGSEECDDGDDNSDSNPDACRTGCTRPRCGDYVTDSNEECDDGPENSNEIPNGCRRNCREAHCDDGVLDGGEECDDGNLNAFDGCHMCQSCYRPKDNMEFGGYDGEHIRLCEGRYEFRDRGREGVIVISGAGITLDCRGATLVGLPPAMSPSAQAARATTRTRAAQARPSTTARSRTKTPAPSGSSPPVGQTARKVPRSALGYEGIGILVTGGDVVLRDCNVEGFRTGVKLASTGDVLFDNSICGNQRDILNEGTPNYGVKNRCGRPQGWRENGQEGCTLPCGN